MTTEDREKKSAEWRRKYPSKNSAKANVIKSVCEPHDFQPVLVSEYGFYQCTKCKAVQ